MEYDIVCFPRGENALGPEGEKRYDFSKKFIL